jgi:hypothetical protein
VLKKEIIGKSVQIFYPQQEDLLEEQHKLNFQINFRILPGDKSKEDQMFSNLFEFFEP